MRLRNHRSVRYSSEVGAHSEVHDSRKAPNGWRASAARDPSHSRRSCKLQVSALKENVWDHARLSSHFAKSASGRSHAYTKHEIWKTRKSSQRSSRPAPQERTNFRANPRLRRGTNSRTPQNAETQFALLAAPLISIPPKARDGTLIVLAGKKLTSTLHQTCTSRELNPRRTRASRRAVVHFECSRPSERAGQPQSRSALRRSATPG